MFRGSSNLTLDNKGRLVVPARYRDVLLERCAGHLVVTAHPHGCLLIYPLPEWEIIEQKLEPLATLEEDISDMLRLVNGMANDTQMDAAGRLLVSPELRSYANLEKDVVLTGMGKKFELWNQETLQARLDARRKAPPGALAAQLPGFSF